MHSCMPGSTVGLTESLNAPDAQVLPEPPGVRVWRSFSSRPERVFDAFLDPRLVRAWFGPSLGKVIRVDISPHVGGPFSIVQHRSDVAADVETYGVYRELDRPHRLVLTWATPAAGFPESLVTIDLESRGGGSAITVTHQVDPRWAGRMADVERGWTQMLDAMADALGFPASDDPSIDEPSG